jgi:hypothetical protein
MDNGLFDGFGVYTYESESVYQRYEGSWVKDKQEGAGTLYWKNGEKYIGHFRDDKMHGLGIKISSRGHIIHHGQWNEECFIGKSEERNLI